MAGPFGDFSVGPDGRFVDAEPRPLFKLLARFGFRDPDGLVWEVPTDTEVDGASIPGFLWARIGGPFEGKYLNASIVHDHFCQVRTRTAAATHRTFHLGMPAKGVSEARAKAMFSGVTSFGPDWDLAPPPGDPTRPTIRAFRPADATAEAEAVARVEAIERGLEASDGMSFPTPGGPEPASLDAIEADARRFRAEMAVRGRGR